MEFEDENDEAIRAWAGYTPEQWAGLTGFGREKIRGEYVDREDEEDVDPESPAGLREIEASFATDTD